MSSSAGALPEESSAGAAPRTTATRVSARRATASRSSLADCQSLGSGRTSSCATPAPMPVRPGFTVLATRPSYTARILNAIEVSKIRGFFTNDTHQNWTSAEVHWAQQISKLTHGAHFIVNTSDNGRGPKLNPHPVTQGTEALCNPPDRGIGPMDTTATTSSQADAFLWTHPPGNSSGSCGGGTPSGTFWAAKAISMAAFANSQLGPGYPSRPY